MLILCIADAEKDVGMKNLSPKEAIALLRNLEDSLDSYCELNEEGKTAFRMAIEALNCSEIPNNWIPCSERLPEDNTRVQVTFANGEVGQSSWHKENEYNNGFDAVMHGVTDRHFVTFGVIAWMPLPEPYQGGEQE